MNSPSHAQSSSRTRGMTLIEVAIALGLAALLGGIGVASINALTHSALRSSATQLTGAIKFSYDRSIMQKRTERLCMDLDKGVWWIDFTPGPFTIDPEAGKGKEEDEPEPEEPVEEEISEEVILAAPFQLDEAAGAKQTLPGDVRISKVWTESLEEPIDEGMAHIHFFSSGYSEAAQVELTDGDTFFTLILKPLTGGVQVKTEPLDADKLSFGDDEDEGDEL
jgi:general secretion pathway protein H